MALNPEIDINIYQQIISKLMEENNQLNIENNQLNIENNQLKNTLKNKEERGRKREGENNLQKSQKEIKIKEIEELKNGLLLLTEVNKEREDDGLISKGNTTDIWDAARRGILSAVKFYYRENPENIHKEHEKRFNCTPLHYASLYGHFNIAKFLISKNVNKEAISYDGSTPLMMASWRGRLCIIDLLLESRAKINHQDINKETCLHWAVEYNHLDCVKFLINKGADKTLRNNKNETPLDLAKRLNKTSIVEYLSSI